VAIAEIWVDPQCPWTWLTSRWLLEVEKVRDVQVRFHVMSLSVIHENDAGLTETQRQLILGGWGPVRVAICGELSFGPDGLRKLYVSLATLIHQEHKTLALGRDLYAYALSRAGLPHSLANAATMAYYDPLIRASHRAGLDPAGTSLGCPIVHLPVDGAEPAAFFGPVVTPSPRGEAAGRLWDAVMLAARTDGFFELKRQVNREPAFD
jgi:hypothetical protein